MTRYETQSVRDYDVKSVPILDRQRYATETTSPEIIRDNKGSVKIRIPAITVTTATDPGTHLGIRFFSIRITAMEVTMATAGRAGNK
jgi:hypothetical protein